MWLKISIRLIRNLQEIIRDTFNGANLIFVGGCLQGKLINTHSLIVLFPYPLELSTIKHKQVCRWETTT